MRARHGPPSRLSSSTSGAVKPLGPHHCFASFTSVHAFQTRSRGASKVRLMTSSRFDDDAPLLFAALRAHMFSLLRLKFFQLAQLLDGNQGSRQVAGFVFSGTENRGRSLAR